MQCMHCQHEYFIPCNCIGVEYDLWIFKTQNICIVNGDLQFPILICLFPGGCVSVFSLYFLCGILSGYCGKSTTHMTIHLFPGYSWSIYQRDKEGSIYQRIHHVLWENPVTRKAHKNKKALIILLAQSEWMDCFCLKCELRNHSI